MNKKTLLMQSKCSKYVFVSRELINANHHGERLAALTCFHAQMHLSTGILYIRPKCIYLLLL
jgi:hypothetical protein